MCSAESSMFTGTDAPPPLHGPVLHHKSTGTYYTESSMFAGTDAPGRPVLSYIIHVQEHTIYRHIETCILSTNGIR